MAVTLANAYDIIFDWENIADPTLKWRNTLTFFSSTVPSFSSPIVVAMASFISNFAHNDAILTEAKIYNWSRGANPYPLGSPIAVHGYNVPGNANSTSWPHLNATYVPTGGEVCLRVDHLAPLGKPGRSFFRALLGESDVHAVSGGKWVLTATAANLQADMDAISTASGMSTFINPASSTAKLIIVRYSKKTGTVGGSTGVQSLNVIDATTNKQTRKNKK